MISRWISGEELLKKYTLIEILHFIREGLQPHDKDGLPIHECPFPSWWIKREQANQALKYIKKMQAQLQENRYAGISNLKEESELDGAKEQLLKNLNEAAKELQDLNDSGMNPYSWQLIDMPYSEEEKQKLDSKIREAIFSRKFVSALTVRQSKDQFFPCKKGTRWEDITITLLSDEMVKIAILGNEGRFTYHQLGLQDKRSGDKPKKLWALLQLFAKRTGFLHSENIPHGYDPKLTDTAKRLNKHLQKLFGIQESIYRGHYKKEGGYRTKIKFEDKTF